MEFFAKLEQLISSNGASGLSPAAALAEIGSPSVSIAVLDNGSITSKCFSTMGDNSETLFQACSISKPIAGMATMRLVQQGKLELDDTIVNLLPKDVVKILETPQTKKLLPDITVRHLMSHTSGLSVGGFPGYSKDAPTAEVVLSGKAPANTLQVRVEGLPGYAFSYSGGGVTVLQIILETVTGKDFPTLIKELVLEPLGMTRSFYILPDGETNVTKAHSTGYTPCDVSWHTQPEKAAAGLWTTPTDLLKAVRGMQRSLKSDSRDPFLQKEIAVEMLSEVQSTMALTWIAPRNPGIAFGHGGSNYPGWECFLMGYSDLRAENSKISNEKVLEDCGICVMTNSAAGFTVWSKVVHAISYLKHWTSIPLFNGRTGNGKVPFCAYKAKVDEKWVEWMGTWVDAEKELVLEADEQGRAVLRHGESVRVRLVPAAIPSVEYTEERGKSIDFVLEGLELMIRLGWEDGKRVAELWQGGFGTVTALDRK